MAMLTTQIQQFASQIPSETIVLMKPGHNFSEKKLRRTQCTKFFKIEVIVQTQTATKGSHSSALCSYHYNQAFEIRIAVQSSAIVNASNVKRPMIDVEGADE